ncbi:iron chelate uptake ABC transporter family permease subunit [Streptomyces sp. HNM0575]|uniref:FecCD family ABC transporter permease n=1 Tax=Streptomyces sp. HNM0575 TaxID=2716338 RepID=UPI00145C3FFB|nr:iron chelate uptake ABC transporter family permease subunit [Streptomyces sp. HNM0575]NLU75331.1 iron chelate uptake ABC transporter family permease subunit [Streptomyces sp. HNM0575]
MPLGERNGTGAPTGTGPPVFSEAQVAAAVREVRRARRAPAVRSAAVAGVLAAGVLAVLCASLSYGEVAIPVPELLRTLAGGGTGGSRFVLLDLRLPRALTGLLTGAAFGMSGAVFQTMLRNPLASPDIIGISAGASAAAVLGSLVFGLSGIALSGMALAGALVASALIYALAWRRGVAGYRLVLVGIGVGAALSSLISYVLTRSEVTEAQQALVWLTGSLNERSWKHVWPLLGALAVLTPLTFLAARTLRVLELGDETAGGLGAAVQRSRVALLACAVGLSAAATAAAGPVAFVAFVSAPIARRLAPSRGPALTHSALLGSLIVLLADFVAQHLLGETQFPVGVVTSVIGAPYLLWLLARTNRVGKGG